MVSILKIRFLKTRSHEALYRFDTGHRFKKKTKEAVDKNEITIAALSFYEPLLNKFIDEQGIEIEKILVTHGHLDHAGSVKAMADERNIPIIGPHKDDKFWIDGMPEAAAQ